MPSAQLSPLSARSKLLPASRSKDLKRRQSRWASSSAHAVTIPAVKHANGVCMSPHRPASPRPSLAIMKGVPVVCPPWRSRAKVKLAKRLAKRWSKTRNLFLSQGHAGIPGARRYLAAPGRLAGSELSLS